LWGLGPNVQVVIYQGNGLGSTGDGIRVWAPGAAGDSDVVDTLDFGAALRGSTFVYNPDTGIFDGYSTNGVHGAFKAVLSDDVGSPGTNTGPVALAITQQPADHLANPGDTITFTVGWRGLPRPHFQWQFNGTPIPGAHSSSLSVTNVQSDQLGSYN